MRRVARRLTTALCAICLLLCLATLATWRASRGRPRGGAAFAPPAVTCSMQLARKLPEFRFDQNRLADVIDFFRDVTGAKVLVDWPALRAAGVNADSPVTHKCVNERFGDAFIAAIESVDRRLVLVEQSGVLYVTTAAAQDQDPDVQRRAPDPLALRSAQRAFPDWDLRIGRDHRLTCAPTGDALRLTLGPADAARLYKDGAPAPDDATQVWIEPVLHLGGLSLRHARPPLRVWIVAAPFWQLSLILAAPPLLWLVALTRRLRQSRRAAALRAGLCPVCGYDLRATPGRCPECGRGVEMA